MPVDAVAFDMDGVLTQSMDRHYEAYRRVFEEQGVAIEPHEVYAREGQKAPQVVRHIGGEHGLDVTDAVFDAMAKRKQEIFYAFGPLPLYPGAADLVHALAEAGTPIALVTGTWKANAEQHLDGLLGRFQSVVAADDVTNTKPHPEPYAKAFAALRVAPANAIVVENAVLGIQAAKGAGATVVGVTSTLRADELIGADVVVPDLAAVRRYLAEQGVAV